MTVIVIHAGMPKAGSSSIQRWLQAGSANLRERGFTVAVSRRNEAEEVVFAPHEEGGVNSGWIVDRALRRPAEEQEKRIDAFLAALTACAGRYGNVVISGESFAVPFWSAYPPMLAGLQRLAASHEVRIAYYARPQHTSLEAAWCQWGYRSGVEPAAYIENRAAGLHYASTRDAVQSLAPDLRFEPRPFREDLLDSGDVVVDFARRFLRMEVDEAGERVNRSLPLQFVNLLRAAPVGMFWDSVHDNSRLDRIKRLDVDDSLPEDDRIALSRRILRKYAFGRFAAENAELGWEDFVPPPDGGEEIPDLDALDRLWEPRASPAELSLLFGALRAAIED